MYEGGADKLMSDEVVMNEASWRCLAGLTGELGFE